MALLHVSQYQLNVDNAHIHLPNDFARNVVFQQHYLHKLNCAHFVHNGMTQQKILIFITRLTSKVKSRIKWTEIQNKLRSYISKTKTLESCLHSHITEGP